ncbi:hypothetical protein [Myceligenerans pegani]|uniref:Lipoprotein n=1 Tax=Myceligenerans pegani TaxID=2776917 RepID=A0ABR9N3L8_9MICO|nr:hypothetical protein [Myceligenerans sp. TRM 65318]MBE1877856.1 hypothetical protein [Myceligenerans sp. TRM 65318]MBE3020127.1 hypothetical protein [Myceligenerans sp. TRM 65318]
MLLLAAACSTGDEPAADDGPVRPVTVAEAERLANVRFRNFDAGSRKVTAMYTDQGHEVTLKGWFDYTTHTGYGLVSADGRPSARVVWDGRVIATTSGDRLGKPQTSLDGWRVGKLDPLSSPLAVVLTVLAGLGADRPENPLLIRQGGALWLREDAVGERPVTVFAGPVSPGGGDEAIPDDGAGGGAAPSDTARPGSARADGEVTPEASASTPTAIAPVDPDAAGIRYWVDQSGLAHRVDIRLGDDWAVVDLEHATWSVPPLLEDVDPRPSPETAEDDG